MRHSPDSKKIIAGIIALAVAVAAIFAATAWYEKRDQRRDRRAIEQIREESGTDGDENPGDSFGEENTLFLDDSLYGFDHRIQSFLFIGTDNSGSTDEEETYSGDMSDFLLLMVLDYTDDSYGCIQIDRNTITRVNELDDKGDFVSYRDMQICVANAYGTNKQMSAENTVEAVKYLLGELYSIDGYFVMGMGDIGALNSAVGGVQVTVPQDMTPVDGAMSEGATITLDDKQAETFVRSRMSLADDTNAARMTRQNQYMAGVFSQIRSHTRENPGFGLKLFDDLYSTADTTMTGKDFSRIARMLLSGEDKGILSLTGETKSGTILGDGEEHEEFYPDQTSILEIMKKLYSLRSL